MPRKTNKTSHVLNLITNGSAAGQEDTAEEKKEAAVKDEAAKEAAAENTAKEAAAQKNADGEMSSRENGGRETASQESAARETSARENAAGETASQGTEARETLSRENAAGETASSGTADKDTPVRENTSRETGGGGTASKETAPEGENQKESVSRITASGDKRVIVVDETSQNENISSKILDRLTDQLEEEIQGKLDHYHMVNVMEQILKRTDLKQYMKQYDVCMCSRCQADVVALILTRLPAKYVVVAESSTAPIIGFYESKFKVRILTEIIKACMDVKENPRHDRSGPYDR